MNNRKKIKYTESQKTALTRLKHFIIRDRLTCHKAQGGEWKRVYKTPTRAKQDVYVANNMNFTY